MSAPGWLSVGMGMWLLSCTSFHPEEVRDARAAGHSQAEEEALSDHEGEPALEVMEGLVSYYHDSLAGNLTANGERYRLDRLTAASRTLPFGTVVRVVRKDTGHEVIVRINDRGPFGDERRILDMSRAAAEKLDMIKAGVVPVRAEILKRGDNKRVHR